MGRAPLTTQHSTHSHTNSLRLLTSHMHHRVGEMPTSTGRTKVHHRMTPLKRPLTPTLQPGLHITHNIMGSRVASLHKHPSLRRQVLLPQCPLKLLLSRNSSSSLHRQEHLQVHSPTTVKPG